MSEIDLDALDRVTRVEHSHGKRRTVVGIEPERGGLVIFGEVINPATGLFERRGSYQIVPSFAHAALLAAVAKAIGDDS